MFKPHPVFRMFFVFIFALSASAIINAQATRTWVSGVGDDVNPCSRTAPCKTFAGAISKTAEDGEINCLDPGGFGTVTITKSITIDCSGTFGSILGSGTNGVNINITSPTDVRKSVVLRGLSINGAATGLIGVKVFAASSVVLENVTIDGFSLHGISVESTSPLTKVVIDNTSIRNNAQHGINFYSPGAMSLSVSNTKITNNGGNGLNLAYVSRATIKDSVVSGNDVGLRAAITDLTCTHTIATNNNTGILAATGGTIRIVGNTVTANSAGLSVSGGSIISLGSNLISGNTVNGAPSSTETMQ
jgi:hypothetical protein